MRTGNNQGFNYKYSVENNDLEEENKNLKETISHMKENLDMYNQPPLVYCEVIEILKKEHKAKVKGINIIKKHEKTTKEKKGGIISKENFIHMSNLKNLDKTNKTIDKSK